MILKDSYKVTTLILARGGSKGVPRKNLKKVGKHSLVERAVKSAFSSTIVDRVVVSTDDKEIAEEAKRCGAEVPFLRPEYLAQDDTDQMEVIDYTIKRLGYEGYQDKDKRIIVSLNPTVPFRTGYDVFTALDLLNLDKEASGVVSVCETSQHPNWTKKLYGNNYIKSFIDNNLCYRRQDLPECYSLNGAIFATTLDLLLKYKTFYSGNTIGYVMPSERGAIDIDTEWDIYLANLVAKDKDARA